MADGKGKSPGNFFNSDGIVLQNGTPVVNGEKYYCSATGELCVLPARNWCFMASFLCESALDDILAICPHDGV